MRNTSTLRFRSQQPGRETLSAGECRYFTYNDVNLVTTIEYPGGVANYFWYDAMMRRYAMQDSSGLSYFTWDQNGMNLLAERDSAGAVTTYYTHGYTPVDGIGSMVAAKGNLYSTSYYHYPVYDHRGTVVRLVDQNGTPTAYYEYDAWGNQLRNNVVGGVSENRFRYQSNWIDLVDSDGRACLSPTRIYCQTVGRFLQRGFVDGDDWNRYAPFGSGNNPVHKVEPDGSGLPPKGWTLPERKIRPWVKMDLSKIPLGTPMPDPVKERIAFKMRYHRDPDVSMIPLGTPTWTTTSREELEEALLPKRPKPKKIRHRPDFGSIWAPNLDWDGTKYMVSGGGWRGSFGSKGGTIAFTADTDLVRDYGWGVAILGTFMLSADGRFRVEATNLKKPDCLSLKVTPDANTAYEYRPPLGAALKMIVKYGNIGHTTLTLGYRDMLVAVAVDARVTTWSDSYFWSPHLCGCFKVSGGVRISGHAGVNKGTVAAVALVAVLAPELLAALAPALAPLGPTLQELPGFA